MTEDWRDRFYDEQDEKPEEPEFFGCCGSCYECKPCDIKGYEDIGFCQDCQEFVRLSDEVGCDSYWERR